MWTCLDMVELAAVKVGFCSAWFKSSRSAFRVRKIHIMLDVGAESGREGSC